MHRLFLLFLSLVLFSSFAKEQDSLILESPDGTIQYRLYLDKESALKYDLLYKDSLILREGSLGLEEAKLGQLGSLVRISSNENFSRDEIWSPVYGERSGIRDCFEGVKVSLDNAKSGRHEDQTGSGSNPAPVLERGTRGGRCAEALPLRSLRVVPARDEGTDQQRWSSGADAFRYFGCRSRS